MSNRVELISGIYNSKLLGTDENGYPMYDRAVDAQFMEKMFESMLLPGLMDKDASSFQVEKLEGMKIKIKPGAGVALGVFFYKPTQEVIELETSETLLYRVDRVILRVDKEAREAFIYVEKGDTQLQAPIKESGKPLVSKTATRTEKLYDMVLGEVIVRPKTTQINTTDIYDTRGIAQLCNWAANPLTQLDFSGVFQKYDDAFYEYMEHIVKELSGDVAGNLQVQIDRLKERTTFAEQNIDVLKSMTVAQSQPKDQDLNDYLTTGIYFFPSSSSTPKNIPFGVNGILEVQAADTGFVKQIWRRYGTVSGANKNDFMEATRVFAGSWGEWSHTEWKSLTLSAGISRGTWNGAPQYRRQGDIVEVKGSVTGVTQAKTIIGILPEGFRPKGTVHYFAPVSGQNIARWYIDSSGKIHLEWVISIETAKGVYNLPWYSFNFSFSTLADFSSS